MGAKFDFKSLGQTFERRWPVTVNVPLDDGKTEAQTFTARFRTLTEAELAELETATADRTAALLRKAVVGVEEEGETFTPELLETMLRTPYVMLALARAYGEFSAGVAAKN